MSLLSENIRYLRGQLGHSQQKVADTLSITRGRYSKYEDGATEPPLDILLSISKGGSRSEEHTSELQSRPHLVCRLLLEKKNEVHQLRRLRSRRRHRRRIVRNPRYLRRSRGR